MTMWGPPAQPAAHQIDRWAPPRPPVPRRLGRGLLIAFGVLVGYAAVAVGIGLLVESIEPVTTWDPEIAPLAEFVEEERGLEFDHAVPVEYLSDEEWEEFSRYSDEADEETTESFDDALRFMRAIGLAEGGSDLMTQYETYSTDAYVGVYDFEDGHIKVHANKGEELSLSTQSTLVHELTHALDDQAFDIESLYDDIDSSASLGAEALVEGDAVVVEQAWIQQLSDADQDAIYSESDVAIEEAESNAIPAGIAAYTGAPYELGWALVYMLDAIGNERRDQAFEQPPTSEEHAFDPVTFLQHDRPEDVATPEIPDDAEEIDSGTFGAFGFFVMLAEHIDAHEALVASDGWGGDAYVQYELGSDSCVIVDYVADTETDMTEMQTALEHWIAAVPTNRATVNGAGDTLTFTACDPGPDAKLSTGKSLDAVSLPVVRGSFIAYTVEAGANPDVARCIGNEVVTALTVEELSGDTDPFESEERGALLDQIFEDCGWI